MSKAHHKELVPAIELDGVPVTFVATNTLAEFIFGEEPICLFLDSVDIFEEG